MNFSKFRVSQIILILTLFALISSFSACRFKSPTLAEQQELANRGVFNNGGPSWAGSTARKNNLRVKDSGAIPENFVRGNSRVVDPVGDDPIQNLDDTGLSNIEVPKEEANAEDSPLHRIAANCPGSDVAARKALLTENLLLRTRRYESLSKRCPSSPDIQTWLARDYIKAGQKAKAQNALERALSLDPNFTEAQGLLSTLKK